MPDIAYNFDIDKVYQILLLSSTKAIGKKNGYNIDENYNRTMVQSCVFM